MKAGDLSPIRSETPFVICAPVYVCEMPRFLARFLKQLPLEGCRDVYFIFTSGGYCGISGPLAKRMMLRKGMNWKGHAEFKMPRNYVANDSYPMLPPDQVAQRLREAHTLLEPTADTVRTGGTLRARHVHLAEELITLPFNPVWCKLKLRAKDFYATDKCIGCGKCVKLCPLNNIALQNRQPVWSDACTHCMACIGNCPTEAIEYGSITQNKEPYNLGKYAHVLKHLSHQDN